MDLYEVTIARYRIEHAETHPRGGIAMKASVGDHLIVESPTTGRPRRDGEIVGLHRADGEPPYDVRWSDTGRVALVYPGPDAHIHHHFPEHPQP